MLDFSQLTDSPLNMLILASAFIIILYIFFKVAGSLIKLVLTVAVLGLVYYFWQGGTVSDIKDTGIEAVFKDANLTDMVEANCTGNKADRTRCTCIIEPVYDEIHARLSEKEIASVNKDPDQIQEEIRKSMQKQKKEIRACIIQHKGDKLLDKIQDLLVQGNQ